MSVDEFSDIHVLIVTFDRDSSISLEQYNQITNEPGPYWAILEGLIFQFFCSTDNDTKEMLIYFWESAEYIEKYYESDIYMNFVGIPVFSNWNKTVYRIQETVLGKIFSCLKIFV